MRFNDTPNAIGCTISLSLAAGMYNISVVKAHSCSLILHFLPFCLCSAVGTNRIVRFLNYKSYNSPLEIRCGAFLERSH